MHRTPSPLPPSPAPWTGKGPESLPRTPVPPYGQFPAQYEGDYRTYLLSPSSTRTDETFDESIGSQVSSFFFLYKYFYAKWRYESLFSPITVALRDYPACWYQGICKIQHITATWPFQLVALTASSNKHPTLARFEYGTSWDRIRRRDWVPLKFY